MKITLKTCVKNIINSLVVFMGRTGIGRYLYAQIVHNAMKQTQKVEHQGLTLTFAIPNALCKYRIDTFSSKEPETLEWIDNMPNGSIVWDIGANVGLYSCYAAKHKNCQVFAFEPSVFNLELLARNIFLNGLTDMITIVSLPLTDELAVNKLNMTTTDWGGALSTFGESYGYDGQALNKDFEFSTIGISMVEAAELLKIPRPDFIKMDVDGIEHLILKGGPAILQDIQGVLVETNDDFIQQAEDTRNYLTEAGLQLKEKRRWDEIDNSPFDSTYNQIWHRSR